eukprot:CAMPEP_0116975108 /NCGR_PEP_ID=MMETSP0467-20121206/55595_1 /TAXON_ID=283647 /ORGANISM="Mesodinium pulex, Strain SPMC105" /LENGTH=38 /DNA_ID= /DNA_START= /DNA_END= /DNA_ORIENTATION=
MANILNDLDIDLKKELVGNSTLVGCHSVMKNMQEHMIK